MKRLFVLLGLAFLFCVHCGGESVAPVTDVQAAEAGSLGGAKAITISNSVTGNTVAADAGFAADGSIVDIPDGFDADDCRFTAAVANLDGSALSTRVSINSTTGEVLCQKVVQERTEIPPATRDCVASYTMICVRTE